MNETFQNKFIMGNEVENGLVLAAAGIADF